MSYLFYSWFLLFFLHFHSLLKLYRWYEGCFSLSSPSKDGKGLVAPRSMGSRSRERDDMMSNEISIIGLRKVSAVRPQWIYALEP
ncbi:hypothetical protein EDB87DRAFT_577304 [Lactarius vividus]|nr:hypothetical protein EDB87DRAFT_577304 [Lactarius vividus]